MNNELDFSAVVGQEHAKRALEVAAAGHHSINLMGPLGTPKTLLARTITSILPPPSDEEQQEINLVFRHVPGLMTSEDRDRAGLHSPPFRAPHYSLSRAAMMGTPRPGPMPGEISMAHGGILLLEDLAQFSRAVVDELAHHHMAGEIVLRTMRRRSGTYRLPARFLLATTTYHCPCGHWGNPSVPCLCSEAAIKRYRARLRNPLMDAIELHVAVAPLAASERTHRYPTEASDLIRHRVLKAHQVQLDRQGKVNALLEPVEVNQHCHLDSRGGAEVLLKAALSRLGLTALQVSHLLKVARTIADLEDADSIQAPHLAEAIQYRQRDHER